MYDVLVIGGGASGMFAAGNAAQLGKKTVLVEKMQRTGRKILITGKGRCNVTNNCDPVTVMKNTVSNPKFLYSALNNFTPQDTMSFFENMGVPLKTERGNRVFPLSDNAMDIADALYDFCKKNGVKVFTDTVTEIITENREVKGIKTASGNQILSKSVIVATGGLSFPKTGSTGDGYAFAKKLGHTVVNPRPSLVGLKTRGNDAQKMQGLSLKNTALYLINNTNGKTVYKDMGEMLFTHFGASGPMVLSASAFVIDNPENYSLKIDFKPALDEQKLEQRIFKDFAQNINKDIINSLDALLPKTAIPVIVKRSNIDAHKKINQITKEERAALIDTIKGLELSVVDREDIETAIITAGGVSTNEINPKTMESKLVKGLYFTGEVVDVDACTGGFNLQIAFSTAYAAAENA